jgi:hypothetical protein
MIIKQLAIYVGLTFMLSWGCVAVGRNPRFGFFAPIAGALAPGVAALVVTNIAEGEEGVRALVRRLGHWRMAPTWYLIALGLPIAGWLVAVAIAILLGAFSAAKLRAAIPVFVTSRIMFLFAAVEELGWRGPALPRLLVLRRAPAASLILGTLHATWPLGGGGARRGVERRSAAGDGPPQGNDVHRRRGNPRHLDLPAHARESLACHPVPRHEQRGFGPTPGDRAHALAPPFDLGPGGDERGPGGRAEPGAESHPTGSGTIVDGHRERLC